MPRKAVWIISVALVLAMGTFALWLWPTGDGTPKPSGYLRIEAPIDEVDETDVGKGIQHQALPNYFQAWSPSSRRYKPNKRLSYEYAQDDDDDDDNEQHADLVSL